jgi:ATP-dependent HslUV protease ATP-binding subunit HslU
VKQYTALLGAEDVTLDFTPDAVERIADYAARVNDNAENIGARRLHTVMERLLDELSFEAPEMRDATVVINEAYVERMLADIVTNEDLSRYIL